MLGSIIKVDGSSSTFSTLLLLTVISVGTLCGYFYPLIGEWLASGIDYTLLALVTLLFFCVRFTALLQVLVHFRFLLIALSANFILVPLLGYSVAFLFLSESPLLVVGLVIYFMSPCTDWFLSFTRLSGGNVPLGTVLIPINMLLQLLLYPFFLQLFTQNAAEINASIIAETLINWFFLPFVLASVLHQVVRRILKPRWFELTLKAADGATLWITALLILQIFAGNISTIFENRAMLIWVIPAVFTFFVLNFFLGEVLRRVFNLAYPEHALLTMTIAARNAPLMLGVTMVVIPDQALVYAVIVIGMLVEFPHLTILSRILNRGRTLQRVAYSPSITDLPLKN